MMISRKTNSGWVEFHSNLLGFSIYKRVNGKLEFVPKFILFYQGYDSIRIKFKRYSELIVVEDE